jgi:hypothetical protein
MQFLKIETTAHGCVDMAHKRPILALEVDSKIFDEILNSLLDEKSCKNITKFGFNFDDDFPIQKRTKINFDCE